MFGTTTTITITALKYMRGNNMPTYDITLDQWITPPDTTETDTLDDCPEPSNVPMIELYLQEVYENEQR